MTRILASLTALAAAGALVAGCGGSNSSSGGSASGGSGGGYGGSAAPAKTTTTPPKTTAAAAPAASSGGGLALKAVESGGLSFDPKSLSAKAGTVTITMDNPSGDTLPHAVAVEGPGGVHSSGQIAQPGGTSKVTLKLAAGTYTFYCPVDGHRSAGMEGTLTVR
jgi:uncharacterized cupredoxin-like copper-binding protein